MAHTKINVDKNRLKIAILIRNYSSSGGGAERYCVELTKRLAEIHEVHVFSQQSTEKSDNIVFHQIPQWLTKPRYINQLLFSYLTKRATHGKFDIVHSHDMVTHANIYTLHVPCVKTKWTQAKGVKKVLRWINTLPSPRKLAYLWLENRQMRMLEGRHFISVSEYLSRNILESYPTLKGSISIAHPGINPQPINETKIQNLRQVFKSVHKIPNSSFILLFVAHGFKRKGLPAIIAALDALENNDIHLVVVGRGSPKDITINSPTVKQNTHFIGAIKNMHELYPVADAFIHPTLGDTYGMAVLEAMSHGLPVIVSSSQYCGFSEHLNQEEALILNRPTDPVEIQKNINLLYKDPQLSQSLSEIGRQKSKAISWLKTLKNTLKNYE